MRNESTIHIDGRKIKLFREQQKLTQLYLATAVGVTTETISRWENKTAPSIKKENALLVAQSLSVHLDDLLVENAQSVVVVDDIKSQDNTGQKQKRSLKKQLYLVGGLLLLILFCGGFTIWLHFLPPETQKTVQGYRYIPDHILPGQVFPVIIQVTRSGYQGSYMVRENFPASCTMIATTPGATTTDLARHSIKWVHSANREQQTTYIYSVRPENGILQETLLSFGGSFILTNPSEKTLEIAGILETKVSQYHWADTNQDNQIDDYEMLTVYDLLSEKQQIAIDFQEIKAIWAARGYQWDNIQGVLKIVPKSNDQEITEQ